eukprot:SM000163S02298  [mRNA]  locus=s163:49992:54203:+ [translate_table: standard]
MSAAASAWQGPAATASVRRQSGASGPPHGLVPSPPPRTQRRKAAAPFTSAAVRGGGGGWWGKVFRRGPPSGAAPRAAASFSGSVPAPPPVGEDLLSCMEDDGGQLDDSGTAVSFGNDDLALHAVANSVVVADLSRLGRIRVTGEDRLRFLHNQSTADFQSLREGQGCDTVFITNTARTIDRASALVMENAVIISTSADKREEILHMLDRYIFFADKVEVQDITFMTNLIAVVGPQADQLLISLNLGNIVGRPFGSHEHFQFQGTAVTVAVGCHASSSGYTFLLSTEGAGLVWRALVQGGAVPMGSRAWEIYRILQGVPVPGKELTEEFNPLEAGLWHTISTTKGCYIGQETIARLITYDGVKQHLWGVQLEGPVECNTVITVGDQKVGKLTSYTRVGDTEEHFGLCYIKRKVGQSGMEVDIQGLERPHDQKL